MSNPQQLEKQSLRNIVVSIVITPEGEGLRTDASVSVNGRPADSIQVGLVLAGDIALAVSAGTETTKQLRAVAAGAVSLAEGLRERVFTALEEHIARSLQTESEAAEPDESSENILATAA